jgi:hypothetical protein
MSDFFRGLVVAVATVPLTIIYQSVMLGELYDKGATLTIRRKIMRITYWLKLSVLVFIVIFSSCFAYGNTGYSVTMEEKGYLWDGEIVDPWYFISPSPQPWHFAEAVVVGLQEAKKGYIISFTASYAGEEIIIVQDSRKLYTALITITDGVGVSVNNFLVELLVKPSKTFYSVGVTKFGVELSSIIKLSVEGM